MGNLEESLRENSELYLFAAEASPFAVAGGVAGYVEGLAKALFKRGWKVNVVIPAYKFALPSKIRAKRDRLVVTLGFGHSLPGRFYSRAYVGNSRASGKLYFLDLHPHFSSVGEAREIYRWPDFSPWVSFSSGAVELVKLRLSKVLSRGEKEKRRWEKTEILFHCNDAHTALIPLFLRRKFESGQWPLPRRPVSLLTVHNLLEQGLAPPELLSFSGFPSHWFTVDLFEYYGKANCLKAGLLSADRVNAVSPRYREEIVSSGDFGFGLEGVFQEVERRGRLSGVLNGIDVEKWKLDFLRYDGSESDILALSEYKESLRRELFSLWGWDFADRRPIFSFRGRWDLQKGIRFILEALPSLLPRHRFLFVTWGYPGECLELRELWERLLSLERQFPDNLAVNPKGISLPDETAKHYAISDFLLMPSTYEPCGLVQMECQRYGVIPVVHATGGLADTVSEVEIVDFPSPNGITFHPLTVEELVAAVSRAEELFFSDNYKIFLSNVLVQDNSWERRALDYEEIYFSLLRGE